MRLRVGVVGIGPSWETRHRPALRALADRFDVRAICDPVQRRAEIAAAEFDSATAGGFQAIARREDVDAVLILSGQWYGWLPILACCETGKSVYCADDLRLDLEQASRIKRRVEESGIAFVPELPNRLCAATLRLKELIATHLGQPNLVFCHRRRSTNEYDKHLSVWRQRDLFEMVDWCHYVVDAPPSSVLGIEHCSSSNAKAHDYVMMNLRFEATTEQQPAIAQISCGSYVPPHWNEALGFRPPAELQVSCERGVAFIDLPTTLIWFDEAGRHMESLDRDRDVGEQLLLSFYRAATSFVHNTTGLEDAYRALQIVMNAKTSCVEGRRISLEAPA